MRIFCESIPYYWRLRGIDEWIYSITHTVRTVCSWMCFHKMSISSALSVLADFFNTHIHNFKCWPSEKNYTLFCTFFSRLFYFFFVLGYLRWAPRTNIFYSKIRNYLQDVRNLKTNPIGKSFNKTQFVFWVAIGKYTEHITFYLSF